MKRVNAGLLAAVLVLANSGRVQADLVTNGGFETGNFAGWTQSGNLGFTTVTALSPASGTYAAALGPVGTPGYLGQLLPTAIGQAYTISFALSSDGLVPSFFSATFGSQTLLSQTDIPATSGYTTYTFTATATSALTSLVFGFRNDPGFLHLDDVSVNLKGATSAGQAPEPGSLALLGIGAVGLAGYAVRRRKRLPQ